MAHANNQQENNNIQEIKYFREMLAHCTYNSSIVLDLDNTILEPTEELGSDQWFEELRHYISSKDNSVNVNELALTLYYAIQQHVHAQATEQNIKKIINALQYIGLPVIGLTARGAPILDATVRQLVEIALIFLRE